MKKNYFSKIKKYLALFLLFILQFSYSQQYPVRIIPNLFQPYSLKLGDYATSTDNKLQLIVLMTDLMEPQHQTGLKFSLEAGLNAVPYAQSNDFVVGMQPFTLFPGSNITLTNIDVRALFELQNLNGINAVQYAQPLSDGVYRYCFQAYDYYTKRNLSDKSCTTVFLVQYEPPMLNLPQKGEKVIKQGDFQNLVFQWMPRQIAPNTRYIFTLKELWDVERDPVSGFLSSPPLWREETYAPTLFYGMDKTQLIAGKRYAWQVQAKSGNPVLDANPTEDNGVYRNNGLSEIFYFDYVENCAVPTLLMAKNAGRGRVELSWSLAGQPSTNPMYSVQYRKRGSSSQWQTVQSYQPRYIVTGLEDQTEYEYRIGSVCGNLQTFNNTNPVTDGDSAGNAYAYSGVQYFTTDSKDKTNQNYQCGVMPAVDIANKNPLQSLLGANEVFTAGDFPVTVISAQGSNGIYSGTGYIVVPYLADTKVKVSFNNIKLNTDKKLIEGVVETTYDPNESAVAYASSIVGETFGDQGVKEITVDYNISDIKYTATPPPGKITIIGDAGGGSGNGGGSQQDLVGGKDYQIKDKAGNIWNVDENGNVTKGGKVADSGASNSTNTDGVTGSGSNATVSQYTAKGINIVWEENANGQYAYDTVEKTKLPKDKYPSVKDADGKPIYVSYKATVNKQTELFDANVSITDPTLKDAKIEFKTLSIGKAITAKEISKTDTERTYQLELIGAFDYAEEEVIAVVVPKDAKDKQQVINSFRLVHLSPKTIDISLVPLDANSQSKLQSQGDKLNQIYKKIGVNFNVKKESVLDIGSIVSGDTIGSEDADLMSTYSPQQQQINALYKGKDARYVLFVTDKKSSTGQKGYMRLNGQFGYVYNNAQDKTGAHELGHGIFKLEHPWKAYGTTQSATPLLMDYSTGEELSHLDWKQINDPAFKLYAFQSQSSGQDIDKKFILNEDGYFMTPSNKLIKLAKGTEILFYCAPPQSYQNNVLHGFKTPDGFYWENATQYQLNVKTFDGFYKVKKDKSGWEKDNLGNRILFADTNYNYNGAGKYPVFYILWVNLGNDKSEYRIHKGEINITGSQISSNKYFGGAIADVLGASNLPQVDVITSTGCQQMVQDKGELYQTIKDPQGKYEIKVFKNKDGKLNVEFKLKSQGNPKTKDQQTAIEKQVETLMNEKLQELGWEGKSSDEVSPTPTEDGGEFMVKEMNGKQWLETLGDLGTNVWENATMPESYWNKDKGYAKSNIHIPPTFAGVGDGVIDQVTQYPQLIKLGYDVATKKQVRDGIWTAVKNISPSSVYTLAENAVKDKISKYNFSDKPYLGYHEVGKDGVAVVSTIMGAGFLKAGEGAVENGTKEVGEKLEKEVKKDIEKAFVNNIDGVINNLKKKAKYVLEGTGEYGTVGGHHPLAKKAFEGVENYDYKKAFSISKDAVGGQSVHNAITGQQNSLYSAWRKANPLKQMEVGEMADIEIKAMANAGIPEDVATGWVVKGLEDLQAKGVKSIANIPWNGVN